MEKAMMEILKAIQNEIKDIKTEIKDIKTEIKDIKNDVCKLDQRTERIEAKVTDNHQGIRECLDLIVNLGNKTIKIEQEYIKKDDVFKLKVVE